MTSNGLLIKLIPSTFDKFRRPSGLWPKSDESSGPSLQLFFELKKPEQEECIKEEFREQGVGDDWSKGRKPMEVLMR